VFEFGTKPVDFDQCAPPRREQNLYKLAMENARWLFFDLGNTLISEETATERRIQRLVSSLARYDRHRAIEEVRAAFREASEEFAPRLITRAIEKLIDDLEYRKLILAEARYDKELESPYEGAEQPLRTLSSRYEIGVIANQPPGTDERLRKWGLISFISICLSSTEVGLQKPDPAIFQLALSQSGCEPEQAVMIGDRLDNDIRPARLLGWKTIRIAQGFARFQSPRDGLDEADLTLANVKLVVPVFTGDLAKSS
jgi:HAD superfamily hydrolase (TIGR01549 family)